MTRSTPLVSVVVPAFNAEATINTAVDSVLGQTLRDFELIVIDDGSRDETAAVLEPYGGALRCLRQTNGGVSRARNHGIAESRGRYVAFLDADDAWVQTKLEKQIAALVSRSDCQACYAAAYLVDERLSVLGEQRSEDGVAQRDRLLVSGNLVTGSASSVICERALLREVGGFDEGLSLCADWDLWVRLSARTTLAYVDEPLTLYRQSAGSMSRNPRLLERDTLALLDKAFSGPDPPERRTRNRALGRQYRVLSGAYWHATDYHRALRCLLRALRYDPRQAAYAIGLLPRALQRRIGRKTPPTPRVAAS
jgi:glycosyltransferase involved in cell wall biosynthesis